MMNTSTNLYKGRRSVSVPACFEPKTIIRGAMLLCAASFIAVVPSQAASVRGTVSNGSTETFLERAVVRVEGTNIRVQTEKDGSFRISDLPEGRVTLQVSYAGLDSASRTVELSDSEVTSVDIELSSDVYELDVFTVTSFLEGVAFASNQQRQAESVRTVTSVDSFIDTVTGNPGEFLKNLQGVQMDYSQNEPNKIRVRGIDPNLTTVTMDGNEVAGAASSGTNRALEIDQLTISGISNVEVYKAPVPWMSANAIGGSVNFQTKSAFDVKGKRSSITLGLNTDSHDFLGRSAGPGHGSGAELRAYPIGRFDYTNTLMDNRLGVFFTLGRDHTNQVGSSITSDFSSPSAIIGPRNGGSVPADPVQLTYEDVILKRNRIAYSPNRQLRTRTDGTLNLDYKVNDNLVLFLKTTHSAYHSTNRNHSFNLATGSGTFAAGSDWDDYTVSNVEASQGISVFEKRTKSTQFNTGLRFINEKWKIDFNIANSTSNNTYDNPQHFSSLGLRMRDRVGLTVKMRADSEVPVSVVQNSGPDMYDLGNYEPNQGGAYLTSGEHRDEGSFVRKRNRDTTEDKLSSKLDVRRYFNGENRFYLQGGLSLNDTERDILSAENHYYWVGDDGVISADDYTTASNMARFKEQNPVTLGLRDATHIQEPDYLDTNALQRYWEANPQVLELNTAATFKSIAAGTRNVQEKVLGYYGMGSFNFEKLNVLAGVRVETTDVTGIGPRVLPTYDSTKGQTAKGPSDVDLNGVDAKSLEGLRKIYTTQRVSDGYTSDPFPYLHLKYDWTPQFLTRFSYTESIGRPNFGDIIPNVSESPDSVGGLGRITITNAALAPQRSENLDFSAEYYAENGVELTFGWFNRDITDFINSVDTTVSAAQLEAFGLGSEYDGWTLRTKGNIGFAKWAGWEVGARVPFRQMDGLPEFAKSFEVFGNYTKIYSMDKDLDDGAPKTDINNVVPDQYTAGVSYRSRDGKILLRLSQNYQGVRISDDYPVVNASQQDRARQEVYKFLNFEGSYKASDRLTLIATARNVGETRQINTQYGLVTNKQQDTGIAFTLSAKYDL